MTYEENWTFMSFNRTAAVFLIAASLIATAGCSSDEEVPASSADTPAVESTPEAPVETPEPVELTGEWAQTNSESEDNYQAATITDETIEIYWVSNGGDTKSLYWAGTVEAPGDATESFSWDSVNDTSKTDTAMLASGDDTKTFTYEDGEISYEASALGTTTTVRLGRE